jgi:hypothetical protein
MQNARLSELEKMVAKSSSSGFGRTKSAVDFKSTEEYNNLKEENRVVRIMIEVNLRSLQENCSSPLTLFIIIIAY